MSQVAVLHKILHIREQEKTEAQAKERNASAHFEKVATLLYEELKNKEKAESQLQAAMSETATITKIKEQSVYITNLSNKIKTLQQEVDLARKQLAFKQAVLKESFIEVKKIEKLIEIRNKEQNEIMQKHEMQIMDDISIRQFVKVNKNR